MKNYKEIFSSFFVRLLNKTENVKTLGTGEPSMYRSSLDS